MAKSEVTGKRRMKGHNVSHSNIKTKRWQQVNVQKRRVWVPEVSRFITVKLTAGEIRTVDKIGFVAFAKKHGYAIPGL
jgi:large subunit ribosomal protein L28